MYDDPNDQYAIISSFYVSPLVPSLVSIQHHFISLAYIQFNIRFYCRDICQHTVIHL